MGEPYVNFSNFYAQKKNNYFEKNSFHQRCDTKFSITTALHFHDFKLEIHFSSGLFSSFLGRSFATFVPGLTRKYFIFFTVKY